MRILLVSGGRYPGAKEKSHAFVDGFNLIPGVSAAYFDADELALEDLAPSWDWAFIQGQGTFDKKKLRELRKKVPHVLIWDGDALNPDRRRMWLNKKNLVDLVVSSSLDVSNRLRKLGLNSHFVPQSYISEECPLTLLRMEKRYDVTFIGRVSGSDRRLTWLRDLQKRCRLGWFGEECFVTGSVLGSILAASKIVIDIKREQYRYGPFTTSNRLFTTMGAGAFYLTYQIPGLEMFFKEGEHLAIYEDSHEALLRCINFWLREDNESRREEIAKAGQAEVLGKHTLSHRIRHYLRLMEAHGSV